MAKVFRKFGGKTYRLFDAFGRKAFAQEDADELREEGQNARVIKGRYLDKSMWLVYARGKSRKRRRRR